MNALGSVLMPYTEEIALFASTVTMMQMLSPVFILNDIRKKGTSDGFPLAPFIGGFSLSLVSLKYAAILRDDAMTKVNLFGLILNIFFIIFYLFYTPSNQKNEVWKKLGIVGSFSIGCILYADYENPKLVEQRFGMLITIILIALVGSPLLDIGRVIRTKNTESLPIPLILTGTLVSFAWLLYGFAIQNEFVVIQNLIIFALSVIQVGVLLFCFFSDDQEKKLN